jgi:hypothetical protein
VGWQAAADPLPPLPAAQALCRGSPHLGSRHFPGFAASLHSRMSEADSAVRLLARTAGERRQRLAHVLSGGS